MLESNVEKLWALDDEAYRAYLQNANGTENESSFARYFFHVHTDYGSPKDAILTVKDYVKTAKAMGAKAISVTDHGTVYAVHPLYKECKKAGLKLIIGVEFYVCDTVEDTERKKHTRLHLCAYAKNRIGYRTLSQLVTAANERSIVVHTQDGDLVYPCISKKLLEEHIAPGTEGHGNVILTSACIGGVLTGLSSANDILKINIENLKSKYKLHKEAFEKLKFAQKALIKAEQDKAEVSVIAGKTYKKREGALKRNPDPAEEARIVLEKAETEKAKAYLKELAGVIKQAKTILSENQKILDTALKIKYSDTEMIEAFLKREEQEILQLMSELVPEAQLNYKIAEEARWYEQLAGHGNWFIEIQYHGIPSEKKFMPVLTEIARANNIPLLAANDAHMAKKDDAIIRKYINALRFNKWEPMDIGEDELYLKDDASLYKMLSSCVGPEAAWEAMKNRDYIAESCNLDLVKVNHYPQYKEAV